MGGIEEKSGLISYSGVARFLPISNAFLQSSGKPPRAAFARCSIEHVGGVLGIIVKL